MRIAIIGAGISGLMCAYRLSPRFEVSVFEKQDYAGGLCSSASLDKVQIERYNHFFSKRDLEIIRVINELGLGNSLKWKKAKQASIINGQFFDMSRPLSLFSLPGVNIIEKIKLAVFLSKASIAKQGVQFNKHSASSWVEDNCTKNVFERYFKGMLKFKFQNYDDVSASYLWARINEGKHNEIGVLNGGIEAIVKALINRIRSTGAKIMLGRTINRIVHKSDNKWLLYDNTSFAEFDCVIGCSSLKEIGQLCDDELKNELNIPQTDYLNVGCYVLKLRRPLRPGYWLFINQQGDAMSRVIIDTSALSGENVVYYPVYRRANSINEQDQEIIFDDCLRVLNNIDADFDPTQIVEKKFFQDKFIEPVLSNFFIDKVVSFKENAEGFYMPEAMYERHLLKTINTQALKAELVFKKIIERGNR